MRVQVAVPEAQVSRPILDAMLEGTTRVNEALLASGEIPTFKQGVGHVRWKPEPPGQEHFDHAALVLGRGWGDCDDLAPWHAASLRATGEDRGARAVVKKSGPKRWHAVVQRSDGSIDDPSRAAGMGQPHGVHGAVVPVMFMPPHASVGGTYEQRPQLALRPLRDRRGQIEAWQARADLPWHYQPGDSPGDIAMVSLHESPVSSQAIVGACRGGMRLGAESEMVDDYHLDRVDCIADACEGADWHDLAEVYGEEHANAAAQVVGSFFSHFTKLAKFANPWHLAQKAIVHIPGVGPVAAKALHQMDPLTALRKYGPTALQFIPGGGPAAMALKYASPALQSMLAHGGHIPPGAAALEPGRGGGGGPYRGFNIRVQPFS